MSLNGLSVMFDVCRCMACYLCGVVSLLCAVCVIAYDLRFDVCL